VCLLFTPKNLILGQQYVVESPDDNLIGDHEDKLPSEETAALSVQENVGESLANESLIPTSTEPTINTTKNKTIFVITPTYTRPTQMADMTKLAQTLEVAALKYKINMHWIVSEDSTHLNPQVTALLNRTCIPSVQLLGPRPATHLDKRSGRGVSNRLKALEWLRDTYTNTSQEGVIYFADDDNSYDARVFEVMRETQKVSVWPVGLIAKLGVSSPIIKEGKIVGFHDPYINRRKFAVDMAGFAADLQLFLKNPKATMPYKVGYEEDFFIRSLGVKIADLEVKAKNCTEVSLLIPLSL